MTLTEKMRNAVHAPLDEDFKNRVTNMIMNTLSKDGTKFANLFEFHFKNDYGYQCRYIGTSSSSKPYYLIDVPYAYEERMAEINEWMIAEGFKHIPSPLFRDPLFNCQYEITY